MALNNAINAGLPIGIANGGTGQTTQTAAFNALSPLTTKGDLIGFDGTNNARLGVGTDGFILVADSSQTTGLRWEANPAAINAVVVTGASQAITGNTFYIANSASLVTFTLPATAVVGTEFELTALGAGFFTLAQNAGQTVRFGIDITTSGTGGSITATNLGDTIRVVCVTANNVWHVVSSIGNLNVI